MQSLLVLVLLCVAQVVLCDGQCLSCTDLTLVSETSGTSVVLASVRLVAISGIFGDDYQMLRRIAHVETADGTNQTTYRPTFNGGIWALNQTTFDSLSITNDQRNGILSFFGIDWSSVIWSDLRKPLYSSLAARLFISQLSNVLNLSNASTQAMLWANEYTNNGGTTAVYTNAVNTLDNYRDGEFICIIYN